MTDSTARFALPFILPGQAQKELFHNEALARIDAALQAAVEDAPLAVPPVLPLEGRCWIVGEAATGIWAGRERQFAAWTGGGWRYIVPRDGMLVWNKIDGYWIHFRDGQWSDGVLPVAGLSVGGQQVVGARQPPVPSPSGGTIIDAEARVAIAQISAALMSHGLIG